MVCGEELENERSSADGLIAEPRGWTYRRTESLLPNGKQANGVQGHLRPETRPLLSAKRRFNANVRAIARPREELGLPIALMRSRDVAPGRDVGIQYWDDVPEHAMHYTMMRTCQESRHNARRVFVWRIFAAENSEDAEKNQDLLRT